MLVIRKANKQPLTYRFFEMQKTKDIICFVWEIISENIIIPSVAIHFAWLHHKRSSSNWHEIWVWFVSFCFSASRDIYILLFIISFLSYHYLFIFIIIIIISNLYLFIHKLIYLVIYLFIYLSNKVSF